MEEKKIGKIKVFYKNDPKKKVIAFLKNLSIKETLDNIREELKQKNKMNDDYIFVDKENDPLSKDLEGECTIEDVLINENDVMKIFLSPKDENPEKTNSEQKNENIISNDLQNSEQKVSNEEIKNIISNKNDFTELKQEEHKNTVK